MEDPWPLRHLELRTPRLSLRPDDDAGLYELADLAVRGIHPPEEMPFGVPWTDQPDADVRRGLLQHHWRCRAQLQPHGWNVHFLIRRDGRVIGTQGVAATDFGITREVSSGSWLGRAHQGRGLGTEMRAAILLFAFDHLGAEAARSSAYTDNPSSLRVSERLGYRPDGTAVDKRRAERATQQRVLVTPATFERPEWTLEVAGLDRCRHLLLGVEPEPDAGS